MINHNEKKLDVITVGRAGVDLYGQQLGGRLEDMASFAKYLGGCPANIAVGCSRLGLNSAILTRVGDDHMGRFIKEQLSREGVDLSGVVSDARRLTALAILGIRNEDTFPLLFYRENCADMALCEQDVHEEFIAASRSVLVTGTHLSTATVRAASKKAVEFAKHAGTKVILDIDYRPVLWGLTLPEAGENRFIANAKVTRQLQAVVADCDLVVGTEEELHILAGVTDTLQALKSIRQLTNAVIVFKRGALGCTVYDGDIPDNLDQGISDSGVEIEVFNVLGAGDAFMSGFLRGWLRGEPLALCCQWANACGALVVSRHGCAPAIPKWEELNYFLEYGSTTKALRFDSRLEQVHWSTNRSNDYKHLMVFAMDHRSQFEEMALELGASLDKVMPLKKLAIQAVNNLADGESGFGVLLDGRFGARALEAAADYPYWIGRPIELPGSIPLEFEASADVAMELVEWPLNHVVKCLVHYHPDDPPSLKQQQERQLLRLFDACRKTRHELLLEVICSTNGPVGSQTVASAMQRIYDIGIYPDWWKLEPIEDTQAYDNISQVIQNNDPYCRGIVLLGLSAPEDELIASFTIAARNPWVKGFAVGRTIWAQTAREWLSGKIDEGQAVSRMQSKMANLVAGWRRALTQAGRIN